MNQARSTQTGQSAVTGSFSVPVTSIHYVEADGVRVFYRAAGDPNSPVVLLLHGFPASSFMFRQLIPRLAGDYRVIAPDLPGFGFTEVPAERQYVYSFDRLAATLNAFTQVLRIRRFALYVFDYGAPTGFRLAMAHPDRITAVVSQNGNAYEEGLGDACGPIRKYWAEPTPENREFIRKNILTLEGTRWQYTRGVADPDSVPPESYTLDTALLERPGNKDIQLDLFLDYASNVKLYPAFQDYFRKAKPPLLAIWGRNDPVLHSRGGRGVSKGHTQCAGRVPRYRAFCHRDACCRDCGRDERVPCRGVKMSSFAQNATIVLVHGAWADGSCWRNVILPLRQQGLDAICAPIPLTSLTEDIAALHRAIERIRGPVLLTGHAYAGAVIAGAKDDRVKSLVYVAALAPAEGETVADVFYRARPHADAPHLEPDVHGLIWMPGGGFAKAVAHKASPDQTTILEAVQRPIAVKCIQEKAPPPAWKTRPSWFLLAEEDRMIAPETQRYMAERMGAKIRTHQVDHSPMHTEPDVVVGVIREAAQEALTC
jgi:pimeloyl-ACP methyl ester carboxylesterase